MRDCSAGARLPVNGDFEDGYGDTPQGVAATVDEVLTVPELHKTGAKRISVGPMLHANAMGALEHTTTALVAGDLAAANDRYELRPRRRTACPRQGLAQPH
jgi:2-methylisocitrate lyase-like PEP mutase family enzyme